MKLKRQILLALGACALFSVAYSFVVRQSDVVINNFYPPNNSIFDNKPPYFQIQFQQPLSSTNKQKLTIVFAPQLKYHLLWKSDQTLSVIFDEEPILKQVYTATIYLDNKILSSYSFTAGTKTELTEDMQKQIEEQAKGDIEFNRALKQTIQKYPWYNQLPITTNEFNVVFDFEKESFRIRLASNTSSDRRQTIIDNALNALKNIGVDVNAIKYYILP